MPLFGPPDVAKMVEKRDVKGLIKALSYPKDTQIRVKAVYALGKLGEKQAIPALVDCVRREDMAYEATRALSQIHSLEAVKPLCDILSALEEPANPNRYQAVVNYRDQIVDTLAELGDPAASLAIILSIKRLSIKNSDKNEPVIKALMALAPGSIAAIETVLRQNGREFESTQQVLVQTLIFIGGQQVVGPLMLALAPTYPPLTQKIALQYLTTLVDPRILEALLEYVKCKRDIKAEPRRNIDTTEMQALALAVAGLGLYPESKTVDFLLELFETDKALAQPAARSLGIIGDRRAYLALKAGFHRDRFLRPVLAEALGRLGGYEDAEIAVELAVVNHDWERVDASGAVAADQMVAEWGDSSIRTDLMRRLVKLGDRRVVALILNQSININMEEAILALGQFGGSEAITGLIAMLADPKNPRHKQALSALLKIGGDEVIPGLFKALDSKTDSVAETAFNAIVAIHPTQGTIQFLIPHLDDQSPKARLLAAAVLAILGDRRGVPALMNGLNTSDPAMLICASRALGQLREPQAVQPLTAALGKGADVARRWMMDHASTVRYADIEFDVQVNADMERRRYDAYQREVVPVIQQALDAIAAAPASPNSEKPGNPSGSLE